MSNQKEWAITVLDIVNDARRGVDFESNVDFVSNVLNDIWWDSYNNAVEVEMEGAHKIELDSVEKAEEIISKVNFFNSASFNVINRVSEVIDRVQSQGYEQGGYDS